MSHIRLTVFKAAFAAALLLVVAYPAVAQNTINQTSCGGDTGIANCVTNGFLQDLTVNCAAGFPANQVSTVLAQITDRNGPNRITMSGGNCGGVSIVGFNRLTIVADGLPLGGFWNIFNSQNITLRSINFDFSVQSGFVNLQDSQVTFDGVTVKNARQGGNATEFGVGLAESTLAFAGAPSLITNNPCVGISVGVGSLANVANVTISNNGLGQGCAARHGILVRNGGAVNLANQILLNGVFTDGPVDISGNARNGIFVESGTLTTSAEGGNGLIRIHDNVDAGLAVTGFADVLGHVQFDNNHMGGDPLFPGPLQIVVAFGGSLAIGRGVSVQGGLAAAFNASLRIGEGGAMTITGGGSLSHGSTALMGGTNSIDTLTCDDTSWVFNTDNQSVIGTNTCPNNGPRGGIGPQGAQGIQGIQGIPGAPGLPGGVSGLERVTTQLTFTLAKAASRGLTATCPAGKVVIGGSAGTGDPTFAIISSGPGPNANTQWSANFWNTANNTQTRAGIVTAICAFAQ